MKKAWQLVQSDTSVDSKGFPAHCVQPPSFVRDPVPSASLDELDALKTRNS